MATSSPAPNSTTLTDVTFRNTAMDWDARLYPGASVWPFAAPAEVRGWLDYLSGIGEAEAWPHFFQAGGFTGFLWMAARGIAGIPYAESPSRQAIREAAARLLATIDSRMAEANAIRDELRAASEALRCAVVRSDLMAFGWRGSPPPDSEPNATEAARESIPPVECNAPITLSHLGILSFIEGDPIEDGWSILWHGLRFNADDLRRLWPVRTGDAALVSVDPSPSLNPVIAEADNGDRPTYSRKALEEWLRDREKNWPPDRPKPNGKADRAGAIAHFGRDFPKNFFNEIRKAVTTGEWRQQGRKKAPSARP